jgi:hypothetical protein
VRWRFSIHVEHAAEPITALALHDTAAGAAGRCPEWWLQPEGAVRAGHVVVLGVLAHHVAEVPLPGDELPVEALAAHRPHPALRERVRAGRPHGGAHDPRPLRGEHGIELR